MIRLELKDYCHDCKGFEADVQRPTLYFTADSKIAEQTDTIVRCKHRRHCRHVAEYIMGGYSGEEEKENDF